MKFFYLLFLVLPAVIFTADNGRMFAFAAEDELDDDLVDVDAEDNSVVGEDVETDEGKTTTSPNADTFLLFTKPLHNPGTQMELPGGHLVEFLIGFTNKGKDDFVIETVEASFRYPMDFNYHIQNFSAIAYNREVKPGHEATVSYSFLPSENFAGRPFGLNIALAYRDSNGAQFSESVFNETVSIIELDEGLDGETFFLYVFLAAIAILLLVLGQQFLGTMNKRKRSPAQRKTVETGTTNSNGDIDYEWLPAETLRALKSSPNANNKSPKQSPRQRKTRTAGSDD